MSVNVSYKGTVHSYGVSRGMLVQNLKEEISEKQNLHQFKLMLGQTELLDRCPVIKYLSTTFALCYDNKEAAVEINDFTLSVTVVNPDNEKFITEKATSEMTVGKLSQIISRKLSSTQGKWTLKKECKQLADGDLLKTHIGVKTFTVNMQDMQVLIQTFYEHRCLYAMTTRSDMTILEFKRRCFEKFGISDEMALFTFEGCILEEREKTEMTLESYGIQDGSTIELIAKRICRGCPGHPSNNHV